MPWMLAAAAVTVGGSLIASSNASHAAQSAAQAQAQGAAEATAEQRREFDLIQNETQPGRDIGNAALGALGSSFGLPGYANGARAMTGGSSGAPGSQPGYYGYPISTVPATGGPMTGTPAPAYTDRAIGTYAPPPPAPKSGNAGTSPLEPGQADPGAVPRDGNPGGGPGLGSAQVGATVPLTGGPADTSGAAGGQTAQVPDWSAFLNDPRNADILAWAQSGHGDPNIPIDQQSMEQRAAYWYFNAQRTGDPLTGRPSLQMMNDPNAAPGSTGAGGPSGPAPGYTDPTAPNGYTIGPRPDAGPGPSPYVAPARPMTQPLDVSLGSYQQSPDFNFQMTEAQKALGNIASSNGSVYSGARLKAAEERAQQLALGDYNQWRDYTTGNYYRDLARTDANYENDRQFGYGQSRDARGDFVVDRTRSDGLYQDDRNNLNNRFDTRNAQLMGLAGIGQGSTNTSASAAQSFATNAGNNIMTGANAKAGGIINSANAWNSGINNIIGTSAYLAGRYMTGGTNYGGGGGAGGFNFAPGV